MKKYNLINCILIVLLFSVISVHAYASYPGIVLNGEAISFDSDTGYPFVDELSRTQVPLRASMEAIGCSVDWDESTYSVNISNENTLLTVPVGEYYIIRNGVKVPNDTCAQIINGRTYIPIRAIYEAFGAYVSWNDEYSCVEVSTQSPLMQVFFIDVGQGDSVFIDFGSYEALIDAGDAKSDDVVVKTIMPYIDGNLELVIATHPDSDHIGGMVKVFNNYTVERVISSGYTAKTKTYLSYVDSLNSENCVHDEDTEEIINLGYGAYLKIIEAGDYWTTSNDMSVVAELGYGDTKVLLTGDIGSRVEDGLLARIGDIDVLKVAHHGSSSSSSQSFLNVINPEYAVISAGKNNSYGHPKSDTLSRLFNSGAKVYGTFKSGTIILSLNGSVFNFNKSDELSLNDSGAIDGTYTDKSGINDSFVYTANLNTKKFHFSSCSYALKIKPDNIIKFVHRNEAINAGYTPCGVCKP